jgi:hypothetical protein
MPRSALPETPPAPARCSTVSDANTPSSYQVHFVSMETVPSGNVVEAGLSNWSAAL